MTGETATIPGMDVDVASTPVELVEGSESSAEEEVEEVTASGSKRRRKGVKGKGSSKDSKDSKYFAVFKKAAESISSRYTPAVPSTPAVPTIREVVQMMIDCGAKEGTPLFFTACNLALKSDMRELFVAIPTDEGRFDYLERAYARGD